MVSSAGRRLYVGLPQVSKDCRDPKAQAPRVYARFGTWPGFRVVGLGFRGLGV